MEIIGKVETLKRWIKFYHELLKFKRTKNYVTKRKGPPKRLPKAN